MGGRARPEVLAHLAPVELGDGAGRGDHRHDDRTAQVLVARSAQHAEVDQAAAHRVALLGLLARQPVAEGPVGIAQAKARDHRRVVDLAAGQIGQGLRRVQQRGVVVVEDRGEHRLVLGGDVERRGEPSRHRPFGHRGSSARNDHRGHPFAQHLDGVAEAHPLGAHHPVDDRAAHLAGPHAVPEVLGRRDHERGGVVVVERAAPDQVAPGLLERHPRADH